MCSTRFLWQVLDEREGPVPDVGGDVLGAGPVGRQTPLQGLQDQTGRIRLLMISKKKHGLTPCFYANFLIKNLSGFIRKPDLALEDLRICCRCRHMNPEHWRHIRF